MALEDSSPKTGNFAFYQGGEFIIETGRSWENV